MDLTSPAAHMGTQRAAFLQSLDAEKLGRTSASGTRNAHHPYILLCPCPEDGEGGNQAAGHEVSTASARHAQNTIPTSKKPPPVSRRLFSISNSFRTHLTEGSSVPPGSLRVIPAPPGSLPAQQRRAHADAGAQTNPSRLTFQVKQTESQQGEAGNAPAYGGSHLFNGCVPSPESQRVLQGAARGTCRDCAVPTAVSSDKA